MDKSPEINLVLDGLHSGVVIVDEHSRVRYWNAWMERASAIPSASVNGQSLAEVFKDTPVPRLYEALRVAIGQGMGTVLSPRLHRSRLPLYSGPEERRTADPMRQLIAVNAFSGPTGKPWVLINITDMSASMSREASLKEQTVMLHSLTEELRESERRARHLAFHDSLSGLANRALFNDRLQMACEQARRSGDMLALMLIDMNRFKHVNDRYGHHVGDELVRQVAARLGNVVRATDTAGRLGGDEFAILQTNVSSVADVSIFSDRVSAVLGEPVRIGSLELIPSASIGVCLFPEDGDKPETLLRNADVAMYEVKSGRENRWQFFSREMRERQDRKHDLESALRAAIAADELEVYYQPEIDVVSGQVVAMEALLRWHRRDEGFVSPMQFVALAEETGLIDDLSSLVLRRIRALPKQWPKALPLPRIAFNTSTVNFSRPELIAGLQHTHTVLKSVGSALEVEITESMVMDDIEQALKTMDEIAGSGMSIAIDDFGTGYSSLEYLKRFPVRKIKIDKSFIRDLENDSNDSVIATAIIGLSHNLGHTVVAEGVETKRQLDLLAAKNCDIVQGFYFTPALPLEEIAEHLPRLSPAA